MTRQENNAITTNTGYKKSNLLINGKYKSSLLENKVLALAMAKSYKEENRVIAKISIGELKSILAKPNSSGRISGSFYTRLKEIAEEMTWRRVFIEDR